MANNRKIKQEKRRKPRSKGLHISGSVSMNGVPVKKVSGMLLSDFIQLSKTLMKKIE